MANRVRELRRARDMTQGELGKAVGLSTARVSGIETGDHGGVPLRVAQEISHVLERRVDVIFPPVRAVPPGTPLAVIPVQTGEDIKT